MTKLVKPELKEIEDLFEYRKDKIIFYSKYCSIREIDQCSLLDIGKSTIKELLNKNEVMYYEIEIDNYNHLFIVELLAWDTAFFKKAMYKIHSVLFNHDDYGILLSAIRKFILFFREETDNERYCFIDIPSEDIHLIQALTESSFRLVETRLHQYIDMRNRVFERFPVRLAESSDIRNLSRVAYEMRNDFDRFHADVKFDNTNADEYLARFAAESVEGFADIVIVPSDANTPPDGFFAANYLRNEWVRIGKNVSQFVLAAVSDKTCKGWYTKLLSELCFRLREAGADYVITNTQTTNRAALHANEKLNFKYGHTTHILCLN